MPVKILIIENTPPDFQEISTPILKMFKDKVEVYPILNAGAVGIEDFNYFLEEVVQPANFEEIVSYYKDIDLFILDINLISEIDRLGVSFYEYLRKIKYRNGKYNVIEVSNGPAEINRANVKYVSKTKERLYFNRIIEIIITLYPELQYSNIKDIPNAKKSRLISEYGIDDSIDRVGKNIDKWIRWIIHIGISVSFYILLAIAIIFAAYKISDGFINHSTNQSADTSTHTSNQNSTTTATQNEETEERNKEMEIFKPAENIFLYLLPIFIIFGFYNYYKTNTSIYLLNGNSKTIDEEQSTKSMSLSKMIFISSIISYVLIKCTEEVFYGDCENPYRLIGAGTLLIILMSYFVIMYKKEH